MQTLTRKGTFDAAHRIMFEKVKCNNLHGHTYHYELTFSFWGITDLGYAIDFKEIKRVYDGFVDKYFDHATILNPKDENVLKCVKTINSKYWVMALNGDDFCNPSAENMAKELYLAMCDIINSYKAQGVTLLYKLENVRLYETENCYVDCNMDCISEKEVYNFNQKYYNMIHSYTQQCSIFEYDSRLSNEKNK
jgi:6-pyruvoyltetrahydropterin/6-carboxytetrahydropterin synthase